MTITRSRCSSGSSSWVIRGTLGTVAISLICALGLYPAALPAAASAKVSPVHAAMLPQEPDNISVELLGEHISLSLAPANPTLDPDNINQTFQLAVVNDGPNELPATALSLMFSQSPLENIDELDQLPVENFNQLTEVGFELPAVTSGSTHTQQLVIASEDIPLTSDDSGVFAARAVLTISSENATEDSVTVDRETNDQVNTDEVIADQTFAESQVTTTPFVWSVDLAQLPQVPLLFVVPLVLPTDTSPIPTRGQLGELLPRLSALLDAAEDRNAVLAVDPRILVAIRGLGIEAPAEALNFLSRLEASPLNKFLLQFGDADPAAQAALGYSELLEPIGFSFVTKNGTFATSSDPRQPDSNTGQVDGQTDAQTDEDQAGQKPDAEDPAAPQDSATSQESATTQEPADSQTPIDSDDLPAVVPTQAELSALSGSSLRAWPAAEQVDFGTMNLLAAADLSGVILDSHNVTTSANARATIGSATAVISDHWLSYGSQLSLIGRTAADRATGNSLIAARLVLAAQQNSSGIAVALDKYAFVTASNPTSIFNEFDEYGFARPVSELQIPLGTSTLRPNSPTEARLELLRATVTRSAQIDELAPLLTVPTYLPEYQRIRLLNAFSAASGSYDADIETVQTAIENRDKTLLEGVSIVSTTNTQLVGTSSRVPITLHSNLPFETVVSINAAATSAAVSLPNSTFSEIIVPPAGNSTFTLPIRSRVSSGETVLTLSVSDQANTQVFSRVQLPVSIRSSYETILLVVLGVSAASLFGFGIWRSIRRRHQATGISEP